MTITRDKLIQAAVFKVLKNQITSINSVLEPLKVEEQELNPFAQLTVQEKTDIILETSLKIVAEIAAPIIKEQEKTDANSLQVNLEHLTNRLQRIINVELEKLKQKEAANEEKN